MKQRLYFLYFLIALIAAVNVPLTVYAAESDVSAAGQTGEGFHYEHDPMENPEAAKDILVNPDAVYGYSPRPDSIRLKEYADAVDWTDEEEVAYARAQRAVYLESNQNLYRIIEDMLGQGKNVEEIARAVSRQRNLNRLESNANDAEALAIVKKSNLDTYGNEEGPTPDQLYEKYGSWQTVIERALSTNEGMDACLGFYDDNYDTYDIPVRIAAAAGSTYTVQKGDSLWKIAESRLGDGSRWPEIYELNKDTVANPRLIYPGQELLLPAA